MEDIKRYDHLVEVTEGKGIKGYNSVLKESEDGEIVKLSDCKAIAKGIK
jgi:hypothetical protein